MTPDQRPVPRPPLPPSTDRMGEPYPLMGIGCLIALYFALGFIVGWWVGTLT